jgi:hypothetical protein
MLRPNPSLLGLLLVFAVPVALGQHNAEAATKHKLRKASAKDEDTAPPARGTKHSALSAKKKSAAAAKPAAKSTRKKPAEVKLKPAPASADTAESATASTGSPPPSRGPTRIDFDDRLIQGQTNKSGAVYLYDRKELKTASMIKKRESFRDEILSTIYGN